MAHDHLDQAASGATRQFAVADHYDVMRQLDADVHDDHVLSDTEADLALALAGPTPRTLFLPCFGTGRHIRQLLARGVEHIVGVDLSPECVAKARAEFSGDRRVELHIADLRTWHTDARFDAVILLGNSFGDIIDPMLSAEVTAGMVAPLRKDGVFIMDYIGEGYLNRARARTSSTWDASLNGVAVNDHRTPRYDEVARVMSIDVTVTPKAGGDVLWKGCYQKRILSPAEVIEHFAAAGVALRPHGIATELNPAYYASHGGELGMIARSAWWSGRKV